MESNTIRIVERMTETKFISSCTDHRWVFFPAARGRRQDLAMRPSAPDVDREENVIKGFYMGYA